jgi:hypothetical protein
MEVALDLFVEPLGRHAEEFGQVGIEHDPLPTEMKPPPAYSPISAYTAARALAAACRTPTFSSTKS